MDFARRDFSFRMILGAAAFVAVASGTMERALAQAAPTPRPPPYGKPISLAEAQRILDAAQAQAEKMEYAGAIAVVGPAGELIAYRRLDGAGMAQAAQNKAFAAAVYRRPTKAFQDALNGGNAGIATLPSVIASEGGLPLISNGSIVGAIGASGGTPQEDGIVAGAGAAALKR
jgi:uncharacterized protein GlcG (DUF336 family)